MNRISKRSMGYALMCAMAAAACGGGDTNDGPDAAQTADGAVAIDGPPGADAAPTPDGATSPDAAMDPDADVMTGTAVVVASYHVGNAATCIVKAADHTLWCAGGSQFAQIDAATDWATVWKGNHACGIKQNGSMWCWGDRSAGQVGDGVIANDILPDPVQISTDVWSAIAGVSGLSCGIKSGQMWCWGYGLGATPVQRGTDDTWIEVGGVVNTIRARRADGTLWEVARLNEGYPVTQIGTDSDWASLGGGGRGQCMTRTSGAIWCIGDATNRDPVLYDSGGTGWKAGVHSDILWPFGLKTDGTIWRLPMNNGAAVQMFPSSGTFTSLQGDAAGGAKCATRSNGELWCWGLSGDGRMGSTAMNYEAVPVPFTLP